MHQKELSPLAILWTINALLFFVYIFGGTSVSFLKSSVLEYSNIASDPFDGAVSPIAYVPDWSKSENMNKARLFDSFAVEDFIEEPEYDIDILGDLTNKSKSATILRYTYPVVYMGSYRGNYIEYDGGHGAVDMRAPIGTPIRSVANGVVVKVKDTETGDGKYVTIRHDNVEIDGVKQTLFSTYEHMSEIFSVEGTKVARGEVIGKVGMTGITTTPHVHFQIDKSTAPFHAYWPFTFREAADLWLDFFSAINVGLGKENMIRYTINPMDFIKNNHVLGSAPREPTITTSLPEPVVKNEVVASSTTAVSTPKETVAIVDTYVEPKPPVTKAPEPDKNVPLTAEQMAPLVDVPAQLAPAFSPDATHRFSDINLNSPFYAATKYLSDAWVARGYADGGFHASNRITRSETILLYDRLFRMRATNSIVSLPFYDVLPSDEIYPSLEKAFVGNIIIPAKYFRPNDSLTRAEAITLLVRTSGIELDSSKSSIFNDVKSSNSHMAYLNTFARYLGIKWGTFSPNSVITRGELAKILYAFDQKRKKESN